MSDLWKNVTDNIDERFADEAAEYMAKHCTAQELDGGAPMQLNPKPKKSSRRPMVIGICAAAAALVLCVIGGAIMLHGGNKQLLPDDSGASSVTSETNETAETNESDEITDGWQQPKIYMGKDPEVLRFASEVSDEMLEKQKAMQEEMLAQDGDAAAEAIEDGGLDYRVTRTLYVPAEGGEFWIKYYAMPMAQGDTDLEIYFRSGSVFSRLGRWDNVNGVSSNMVCSGTHLYFMQGEGIVKRVYRDGTAETVLDGRVPVPDSAAEYFVSLASWQMPQAVEDLGGDSVGDGDSYISEAYFAKAENGEYWIKAYALRGGFPDVYEVCYGSDGKYELIARINGRIFGLLCWYDDLYYYDSDGRLHVMTQTGAEAYAQGNVYLDWGTMQLIGSSLSGHGDTLEAEMIFGCHMEEYNKWIWRRQNYIVEGMKLADIRSDGYGSVYDNETRKYEAPETRDIVVTENDADIYELGRQKLSDAVKLYKIAQLTAERDESITDADGRPLLDESYGGYDNVMLLYDNTFAEKMYNYGVYYATETPDVMVLTDTEAAAAEHYSETLRETVDKRMVVSDGSTYLGGRLSADRQVLWTYIRAITENNESRIVYELCTVCLENGGYRYEQSEMVLENTDGEWFITKLRPILGNEGGDERLQQLIRDGHSYLADSEAALNEALKVLKAAGWKYIDSSEGDFDFDTDNELFVLAEKNGEKRIFTYEYNNFSWESDSVIDSEYTMQLESTELLVRCHDGYYYFTTEEQPYVTVIRADGDKRYDVARYASVEGAEEYIPRQLSEQYTVLDTAFIDFDFDGTDEYLLLTSNGTNTKQLHIYRENFCYWGEEYLLDGAEVGYMQGLDLTRYDGELGACWIFRFREDNGAMDALVTAALTRDEKGKPQIEYLCSEGTITYSDIAQPYSVEFFRRGWGKNDIAMGVSYNDITEEEYKAYISELYITESLESGAITPVYEVPAAWDGAVAYSYEMRSAGVPFTDDEAYNVARQFAQSLFDQHLRGYDGGRRSFSIYRVGKINSSVVPIRDYEDLSKWNITEEERALENAWILHIDATDCLYRGTINGRRCEGETRIDFGDTGFLMWHEGDSLVIRSRYYNGSAANDEQQLIAWVADNYEAAREITRYVYYSGNNAEGNETLADHVEGTAQISIDVPMRSYWYEVTDGRFDNVAALKHELLRYYTCDALSQIGVAGYSMDHNGRIYARPCSKGVYDPNVTLNDKARVIVDSGDRAVVLLAADIHPETEDYTFVTLEKVNGEWRFADKLF